MPTGGAGSDTFAPDARTRSVWLSQLALGASVIIISVLVLALQPHLFARWDFAVGTLALVAATVVTLAVPWARLPPTAVLAVPFVDALAIGLMATGTELRLGFLWVFPVIWVAMHFRILALGALLAMIGAILLVDFGSAPGSLTALRVFIIMLSLMFMGITAHLALRRTRALRRLLRRQAGRLNVTLARRSDQERRTMEILNGIDTGTVRISNEGRVLAVNDAYARLYGLEALDPTLPARSVEYTALRGMPVPLWDRPFSRAARGETFTGASVWLFTPDREWRALSVTAKRLGEPGDEKSSILLLAQDVTDLAQAERERDRFTAMASHELRHPLTVLIGNAELALELDDLAPRTRERFESIVSASERMLHMTETLTTTSRKGFRERDEVHDLELRQILGDSVASFRHTATAHDVEIEVHADEPLPVAADGFRLRQVIDNLVSNAIKYTPSRGRVRIVGTTDHDAVTLTVSDTGIGISANDLPRITTPYFRTAEAKEKAGGTGLGLGITNEIVAAHGGTLSVDSRVGVGTTVTVRLPRSSRDADFGNSEPRA